MGQFLNPKSTFEPHWQLWLQLIFKNTSFYGGTLKTDFGANKKVSLAPITSKKVLKLPRLGHEKVW